LYVCTNEVAGRWVPLCFACMYFILAGLVVLRIGSDCVHVRMERL
jgi:hypothetical protein